MAETIFEKNGTRLTVILEGRLDTLSASVLEKKMQQHLDGIREVIMDFEKVEYLSSSALRVLLATEQLTKTRGGGVKLWRFLTWSVFWTWSRSYPTDRGGKKLNREDPQYAGEV